MSQLQHTPREEKLKTQILRGQNKIKQLENELNNVLYKVHEELFGYMPDTEITMEDLVGIIRSKYRVVKCRYFPQCNNGNHCSYSHN
jgi:hypothetical protein